MQGCATSCPPPNLSLLKTLEGTVVTLSHSENYPQLQRAHLPKTSTKKDSARHPSLNSRDELVLCFHHTLAPLPPLPRLLFCPEPHKPFWVEGKCRHTSVSISQGLFSREPNAKPNVNIPLCPPLGRQYRTCPL